MMERSYQMMRSMRVEFLGKCSEKIRGFIPESTHLRLAQMVLLSFLFVGERATREVKLHCDRVHQPTGAVDSLLSLLRLFGFRLTSSK